MEINKSFIDSVYGNFSEYLLIESVKSWATENTHVVKGSEP